jgi:uncharacterized delta-60 repeat protein
MLFVVALALFGLLSAAAHAAPGDLDPSFGTGGKVVTDLGAEDFMKDVAVDSAGRIVVLGLSEHSLSEGTASVVRYTPSGTLDPTFGGGDGIATLDLGPGSWDRGQGLAIDGSDRILVAGENADDLACGSFCNFALARLTASGQPDPTFDGDGLVTTGACCGAWGVAIDGSGRIVVAAGSVVRRYLASGAPDPSFDGDGVASVTGANSVSLDGAGRIVVADFIGVAVSRLLATGEPDSTFDGNGVADFQIAPGSLDYPSAMAVDAEDRPLVVGLTALSGESNPRLFVVRFTAAGAPDPGFDGDGILLGAPNSVADDIAVDAAGRLLIVGTGLIRLLPDGSSDPSFGNSGLVTPPVVGKRVTTDAEQRIVVAGSWFVNDLDLAVTRHLMAPGSSPPTPPATPPTTPPSSTVSQPATTPAATPEKPKVVKCRKGFKKRKVKGKVRCVKVKSRKANGKSAR